MAVHIVVDSTADLSLEQQHANNITSVPLIVSFGDEDFRDGVDLDNPTFYAKLARATTLPTTGAPSPDSFRSAYNGAIDRGATGILSIHLTGALSGTLNVASSIAAEVTAARKVPIHLLDSRTLSAGFGLPAILAAQRARDGASLEDLVAFTQNFLDRGHSFFLLDTLENLQRGGRIGKASAVLGTMLSIKPILAIRDGVIVPVERVRTRSKALTRIGELVQAVGPIETIALAMADEAAGNDMRAVVKPFYDRPMETFRLGAVIGTHAGPHAAGLFVTTKA